MLELASEFVGRGKGVSELVCYWCVITVVEAAGRNDEAATGPLNEECGEGRREERSED